MQKTIRNSIVIFGAALFLGPYVDRVFSAPVPQHNWSASTLPISAQAPISAVLGRDQQPYQAAAQPAGYRMENPRHGLTAEFMSGEVRFFSADSQAWSLKLDAYGYGETLRGGSPVAPRAIANRVEYQRGALLEWYVNGPLGLEQGFTIARPLGKARPGPLTLAFEFSGNLSASVDPGAKGVTLKRENGLAALHYGSLTAQDATGRQLPAWLEIVERRMLLRVEDAGARYPLTIDPIFQLAELTASDATAQQLGWSVAVSGDTVVVGSPSTSAFPGGVAYVFVKPAGGWSGSPTETAKLTGSDTVTGDFFGISVAISGDTIVVGASDAGGTGGGAGQGEAYVFLKPALGWSGTLTENAKLTPSIFNPSFHLEFGSSIGLSSDTVAVGAPAAVIGQNTAQGAVYVFVKPGGGWTGTLAQNAILTASDGAASDGLGPVGLSGDTIVAGAESANATKGEAYVFVKPGGGWVTGTESAKLTASDGVGNDLFGNAVAVSGDTIVVGAFFASYPGPGKAYIFVKLLAGWSGSLTESAQLTASDGVTFDEFGWSVGISGDTVVAGAPFAKVGINSGQGAAYEFVMPAAGWSGALHETAKLVASDGTVNNSFGFAVAVDSSAVAVGSPFHTTAKGSAYIFPGQLFPFSSFSAKLRTTTGGFTLNASFTLAANSNGTSPLSDAVTLKIGTYQVTIPAGSFQAIKNGAKKGTFTFSGVIDGVTLAVQIAPPSVTGDGWNFKASAPVDLTALPNPVTVTITIGDDTGTTSVNANQ